MNRNEHVVSHEWQRILDLDCNTPVEDEHSPQSVEPPRFEVLP